MSKLLKAIATTHRPHIAAKMIAENGYNEQKHLHAKDLHKAGIISKPEADDLDGCLDDLLGGGSNMAGALKAAASGELSSDKLNDDEFIKSLMAMDSDTGGDDDTDDSDDDADPVTEDDKITA